MDDNIKEIFRYGVTFVALIALFYGGSYVLSNTLGTSKPMMVVISQSMVPALGVGDFIVIEAIEDFDDVNIGDPPYGDILVFLRPGFSDEYIVHRAIDGYETDDGWVYQTKGDHNIMSYEFETGITNERYIGRAIFRVPYLGWVKIGFVTAMQYLGLAS